MKERPSRTPVSTYRLQLNPHFGFRQARELVPYLSALGITDFYASPIFACRPGSMHGYDICDHNRLNPELGTREDFQALSDALQSHSMGLIVDFVPNHMGIDPRANLMWRSVLENGPSSPFADFFDIDWDPLKPELKNKVLLPILEDQYGAVLESGLLKVRFERGDFSLQYGDNNLPLNPRQIRVVLLHRLDSLRERMPEQDADFRELLSIIFHLEHIPPFTATSADLVADRDREKVIASERLETLIQKSPDIGRYLEENIGEFNGKPGTPESFNLLHQLLDLQPYRLSYWKTASHEINYRRFFDVNELAAIRTETPEVFDSIHVLIRELIRQGLVTGLRLDHVDGLFDPNQYFAALQERCAPPAGPLYVLVEKILSAGEILRPDWAVHGTTGYEFLNDVAALFVDAANAAAMQKLYANFTGRNIPFADLVYKCKKLIVATSMASELKLLAQKLNRISESNRRYRDFTLDSLQEGLREVVACFPVYRSYFTPDGHDRFDDNAVEIAESEALRRNPALEPSMFAFICKMLFPEPTPGMPVEEYQRRVKFAMKFQQYTGPVQAKGVEDTAFYRYGPLLSLNEVGGEPARFGRTVDEFHHANLQRREHWPLSMLCTATHDTKRGEDARCRISVLSEIPDEFQEALAHWAEINANLKTPARGNPSPDRANEYLYYQALLGAWPPDAAGQPSGQFVDRMQDYMLKAINEEKIHTSWIHPNPDYDKALRDFVQGTLTGAGGKRFLDSFLPFQQRIASAGVINSLAQLVLKITCPGVPDFYQGTELWDLSLVDPDNRRPVDFGRRSAFLRDAQPILDGKCAPDKQRELLSEMLNRWSDGRIKLFCTAAGLQLRRAFSHLFLDGEYAPLTVQGQRSLHAIALGRRLGPDAVIAIVPRLTAKLCTTSSPFPLGPQCWADTSVLLPEGFLGRRYRNVLTNETLDAKTHISLSKEFAILPAAILIAA